MHRSLYNENLFIILVELNETLVLFVQSSSEFADQLEGFFFCHCEARSNLAVVKLGYSIDLKLKGGQPLAVRYISDEVTSPSLNINAMSYRSDAKNKAE